MTTALALQWKVRLVLYTKPSKRFRKDRNHKTDQIMNINLITIRCLFMQFHYTEGLKV